LFNTFSSYPNLVVCSCEDVPQPNNTIFLSSFFQL
jgi:hypothetical protein